MFIKSILFSLLVGLIAGFANFALGPLLQAKRIMLHSNRDYNPQTILFISLSAIATLLLSIVFLLTGGAINNLILVLSLTALCARWYFPSMFSHFLDINTFANNAIAWGFTVFFPCLYISRDGITAFNSSFEGITEIFTFLIFILLTGVIFFYIGCNYGSRYFTSFLGVCGFTSALIFIAFCILRFAFPLILLIFN